MKFEFWLHYHNDIQIYYFDLLFAVASARLNNTGSLFKPYPYVELSVDNKSPRKTDYVKSNYSPKWNESFTV